ncbi:PP0621 family protein [Paraburkholderia phosphatilytica]|uniref:PP0621 family protein n=1 Tax=Paraburkholderia phosphatilytica TaxID=2282883 RepID=UPI000E52B768|nr:PP0621 family protein [Paraburkholderia phosphatilytica]
MRQIFLLILLFIVGQWLVKALRRADARTGAGGHAASRNGGADAGAGTGNGANARNPQPPQLAEPMIRCAECGVHAPKSDSVIVAGEAFCSADHAHRHAVRTGTNRRDAR